MSTPYPELGAFVRHLANSTSVLQSQIGDGIWIYVVSFLLLSSSAVVILKPYVQSEVKVPIPLATRVSNKKKRKLAYSFEPRETLKQGYDSVSPRCPKAMPDSQLMLCSSRRNRLASTRWKVMEQGTRFRWRLLTFPNRRQADCANQISGQAEEPPSPQFREINRQRTWPARSPTSKRFDLLG